MTATQPLIFSKDEAIELADDLPNEAWTPRVTIRSKLDKDVNLEGFIKEVNQLVEVSQDKSILIVMNTIKSATQVFNELKTSKKKYYLSANVVPAQRKERIKKIAEALKRGDPLIVVSTQVVEAGVDLDFDMVIRDMGPVDSIIQVAGRCNRSGLRESKESEVYVYSVIDNRGAHYGNRIYGNYLISKSKDVLCASCILDPFHLAQEYYRVVQKGSSELKSQELLEALRKLDYECLQEFKLIEDQPNFSVYVEVDEKASQIWDKYVRILESKENSFERKEEFLRMRGEFYNYVINVSAWETSGLEQSRGFYRIPRSGIRLFYDENTGFTPMSRPRAERQTEAYIY
jgi:CRISPR-associated endonuclease/helicase Cas3